MDNYVGKRLDGRYEIQEIIGVGGMAVVYKAYDSIDDRIVAVKILKEEFLANEDFRRRFKNESKAIAVLSHPNVVKVYDVSYGDKLQYIVMEYVEGITLKEYIEQQGRINWKECVYFVTQILRSLQHAHDKGIVHRDIKPQNIILLSNGTIKVTDFGIARFSRSETNTMTGNAIGSVHYISPEQAKGEITDNKADIYSVGVVLYEMLAGQLPFQSENSVSVALMQLQSEAKRPREINPSIPVGLEQITMKAMQKKTRDRYQSAAEMLLDIDEFKRNPSVKFNYDYYVDNEPTRFVSKTDSPTSQMPIAPPRERVEEPDDEYYDDDDRNKTLPIIAGVGGGLLVLVAIIIGIAIASGVFSGGKVSVPNFVGKNYYDEILNNDEYKSFNIIVDDSSEPDTYEAGIVYDQSPAARVKIKQNETITLYIPKERVQGTVPDVYGLDYSEAIRIIEGNNLKASLEYEENDAFDANKVIRSSPERFEKCYEGSTVILYISKNGDSSEIPDIVGWDIQTAKELIRSVGLSVSSAIKYENSTEDKDIVTGVVTYKVGTSVPKGTEIQLIASNGMPPSSDAAVKFVLPDAGASKYGTIKVFLDNVLVEENSNKTVLLNGSEYSMKVTSSDASKALVVLIDDIKIFDCVIDFTVSPAKVSKETTHDYFENGNSLFERAYLPDVTGMFYDQACKKLADAGFSYIEPQYITVKDSAKDMIVKEQSPTSKSLTRYPLDTSIVLTVYSYESDEPEEEQ